MGNGGTPPAHLPFCQALHEELCRAISLAVTQAVELALAESAKMAKSKSAKAADDRRRQEAAAEALAAQELVKAANDRRRQAMTAVAEALAAQVLAETAAPASALAAQVLAETAAPASALAAQVLAKAVNKNRCTLANDRPPQTVHQRARPRHRTGRRNCPRAPSPIDEALPSHLQPTGGGLHLWPWQSRHCWRGARRGQTLLLAQRHPLLCSPRRRHLLPPPNPLTS